MIERKKCTKCGEVKSIDDYPNDTRKTKKGIKKTKKGHCKGCASAMNKAWFSRNKDYKKEWRAKRKIERPEAHKDEAIKSNARHKKWSQENKDYVRLKGIEYREKNKEAIKIKKTIENRKYIDQLQDCYVISQITKRSDLKASDVREYPKLIELMREHIELKRAINNKNK